MLLSVVHLGFSEKVTPWRIDLLLAETLNEFVFNVCSIHIHKVNGMKSLTGVTAEL